MKFSYLNIVFVLALAIVGFAATTDKAYAWCEWQDTFWGWTEVCYPDPPPEPPPPPPPPPQPQPPYTPPPTPPAYDPGTGCPAFQPIGGNGQGGFGSPVSYEEAQSYVNAANGSGCGGSCSLTDTHWGYTMVCTPPPVYTVCYSGANACGQTSAGVSANGGSCSASTPGNPSHYGQSCTLISPPNSCGQTTTASGTFNCAGACVGTAPAAPSAASCPAVPVTPVLPELPSNPSSLDDLTVGASTVTIDYYGASFRPLNFYVTATVTHIGPSTLNGIRNIFQLQNLTTGETTMQSSDTLNLGGDIQSGIAGNGHWMPAGQYQIRACTDTDVNWVGTISEYNENNNCGGWTTFTLANKTMSCSSSYTDTNGNGSINAGENVTYSASPSDIGAGAYTWDPSESGTDITGNSSLSRTYAEGGTYQMRVYASGHNAGICSVTVAGACATNPSGKLTASTNRVKSGTTLTLSWADIGGTRTSCSLTGSNGDNYTISSPPDGACSVASGSRTSAAVTARTTYNLVCDGEIVDSEIIDIIPKIEEF